MAITGYDQVGGATVEGRALQARALLRSAIAMNDAMRSQDGEQLLVAVTNNARLWLFFYSEIERDAVTLPGDVASNIISLAAYVIKVTPRAVAGEAKVLETLISINRSISAGLSEGSEGEASPAETGPQTVSHSA